MLAGVACGQEGDVPVGVQVDVFGGDDLAAHGGGAFVLGGGAALAGAQADADVGGFARFFEEVFGLVVGVVGGPLHGADHAVAQGHGHAASFSFELGALVECVKAPGDVDADALAGQVDVAGVGGQWRVGFGDNALGGGAVRVARARAGRRWGSCATDTANQTGCALKSCASKPTCPEPVPALRLRDWNNDDVSSALRNHVHRAFDHPSTRRILHDHASN